MKIQNGLLILLLCVLGLGVFQSAHAQAAVCPGDEVCLTVQARGTIQWQSSLDGIAFSNMANGQGDTVCFFPGLSLYYRAVVMEGTCDSVVSDTQLVTVHPGVVADAGVDVDLCIGDSVIIGGTPGASGGTPPYTYNWTPGSGLTLPGAPNPLASPSVTTSYVLTISDANGCTDSDTMTVFVNGRPVANAGPDTTTNCTTAVVIGGSPTGSGGAGPLSYSWSPASGLSSPTDPNPSALGNTTYTVTVMDSLGCTDTDAMVLTVLGASTGIDTFSYTGLVQMWVIPPCVDTLHIEVWGAQGGNDGTILGGLGGYAEGDFVVNSGDTLWFYVGGQGTSGPGSGQNCNFVGGWNGGGATGDTCCSNAGGGAGAGGGGSDVRVGGQSLNDRVIVGAGGGGAGNNVVGGAGGGLVGSNGGTYNSVTATGGTQSAGGIAGGHYIPHTCSFPDNGAFGQGGMGDGNDGGGGGGGWYGGGGGPNNGGGGGGSSYVGGVMNGTTTGAVRSGNGLIIVSW
jgi:hypothetical protein